MSTRLARKSAMLSGKMTRLDKAIELHEEPWIHPLHGTPIVRGLDLDSPQGGSPQWFIYSVGVESRDKNSKVVHEHTEHKEHGEFILVWASRE
jgi:hypothetical protein